MSKENITDKYDYSSNLINNTNDDTNNKTKKFQQE